MIERVMRVVSYISCTFGLFTVGYLAWTNPEADSWVIRIGILGVCITCWYLAIKDIKS